jgi:hypothetical protein
MFFSSNIGIVVQVFASVLTAALVMKSTGEWFIKQDHFAMNANPFAYIFGAKAEKFLIAVIVLCFSCWVYASFEAYIFAALHILGFTLYWAYMMLIYSRVEAARSRGQFLGSKPTEHSIKAKSKSLSLWA